MFFFFFLNHCNQPKHSFCVFMCATATVQKQGPFWFFGERKQNSKRTTQKQRKAKRFAFWRRHHNEI